MSLLNPIKLINWKVSCYCHPENCAHFALPCGHYVCVECLDILKTTQVSKHCAYQWGYIQRNHIEEIIRHFKIQHAPVPQHTWTTRVKQGFCLNHKHSKVFLALSCGRHLCPKCIQKFDKILDTPRQGRQRENINCTCNIPIQQSEIKTWLTALQKEITETPIIQHFNGEKTCERHKGNYMCARLPCDVILCHQCVIGLQQNAKWRYDHDPVHQKKRYVANCPGCPDTIPGELLEMFLKEMPPGYRSYAPDSACRIHKHHKIVLRDVDCKPLCKICFVKNGHSTILLDGKRCSAADTAELFEDSIPEELFCLVTSGVRCDCGVLKAQAKLPCGLYVCYHCLSQLEQKHRETNEARCPKCNDVISTKQLRQFLEKYEESECYLIKTTISRNCIDHRHWKIFCETNSGAWHQKLCLMCIYERKKFPALPIKVVQHFLQNNDLTMKHLYAATKRADDSCQCHDHRHKVICELPCHRKCCFRCIEEILQPKETLHIEVEGVSFECFKCTKCAELIPVEEMKSAVGMCKEMNRVEIKLKKYTNCTRCLHQSKKGTAVFPCGASLCEDCFLNGSGTNTPINVLGQDCIRCSNNNCSDVIPISSLEEIFNKSIKQADASQDQNGNLHTPPSDIGQQAAVGPSVDQEMTDISVESRSASKNVDTDNAVGTNANALSEERAKKNNRRMTAGSSSNFDKSIEADQEMIDTTLYEAAGTDFSTADSDSDNESLTFENVPKKKRRHLKYLKEEQSSPYCSQCKQRGEAVIEFRDCSHRMCENCINRELGKGYPKVRCGSKTGSTRCQNQIPIKILEQYMKNRIANMDTSTEPLPKCDNPKCRAEKNLKEEIYTTFTCKHSLCVSCVGDQKQGENDLRCLSPSCMKKVCFLKTTTNLKCSKRVCSKKAVVIFNECDHGLCIDCVIELSSKQEKPVLCGLGFRACKTVIPMQPLNEHIDAIKKQPSFYIKEKLRSNFCTTCSKKAIIEFRFCHHRFCAECVRRTVTKGETMLCSGKRLFACTNEIPAMFVEEHLRRFNITDVCDNPECSADNENKRETRKLPCRHNLCVICVSMQTLREGDEVFCKVPDCNTAKSNRRHLPRRPQESAEITGIPNIGLTCYASCVLQVLGQTPKFTSKLREYSEGSVKHKVAAYLYELLKHINDVERSHDFFVNWDSMNSLMQAIFKLDRSFKLYRENDCHSFIMSLFNALSKADEDRKEQKPRVVGNSFLDENSAGETLNPRKGTKDSMEGRGSTEREEQSSATIQHTCPTSLFESRLTSQFKYSTCAHKEDVADQLFYSLLLPATIDSSSIRRGLDVYFKSEEFLLNAVPCRECRSDNRNTTTTRTPLLARAPQILMIQLARFGEVSYHGEGYKEIEKTYHSVKFERTLTIESSYTADKRELKYELYGVVIHRGSMHGGHYTSFVRNLKSKKWYHCSDSSVSETSEEDVFQEWVIKHAYLLFYSRKA